MKILFDVITVIASIMTIIAFFALFLTQDKFQYFVIIAISALVAIDTIALSNIAKIWRRLDKLEKG